MKPFADLIHLLKKIQDLSDHHQEKWESFSASGVLNKELLSLLLDAYRLASSAAGEILAVDVDGSQCDEADLLEYADLPVGPWRIVVRKEAVVRLYDQAGHATFFLRAESLLAEMEILDPLRPPTIFDGQPLTIFVSDLPVSFSGPKISVGPLDPRTVGKFLPIDLPSEDLIKTQVHVATSEKLILDPTLFLVSQGDITSIYAAKFNLAAAIMLSAALCQDLFSERRVVVKGLRRVELHLYEISDLPPTVATLQLLVEAVRWVYSERIETRAKLIADRLSLEIEKGNSFYLEVVTHIHDAFKQSVEQYGFVILDRKDAYVKELKDLLKDVRSQADIYVQKLRGLLNNLLRDVLAAFILISINLVTRLNTNSKIFESDEAGFLFKALAIYLVLSLVLQVVVDLTDIVQSRKEYDRWTNATRNYLAAAERDAYFTRPLDTRFKGFLVQLSILALVYAVFAYVAWNFREIALPQRPHLATTAQKNPAQPLPKKSLETTGVPARNLSTSRLRSAH